MAALLIAVVKVSLSPGVTAEIAGIDPISGNLEGRVLDHPDVVSGAWETPGGKWKSWGKQYDLPLEDPLVQDLIATAAALHKP